jgi:hypothetical protein
MTPFIKLMVKKWYINCYTDYINSKNGEESTSVNCIDLLYLTDVLSVIAICNSRSSRDENLCQHWWKMYMFHTLRLHNNHSKCFILI